MDQKEDINENEKIGIPISPLTQAEMDNKNKMAESRLSRRSIKQSKKQLYYTITIIVVVLVLAFNFGPLLITGLGAIIDTVTGKSTQSVKISNDADLQPPRIDPLVDATPSARIKISGTTDYREGNIELFVNDEKYETTDILGNQTFEFERVILSEGNNFIKARVISGDKKSDFSEEEQVSYVKSAPKLEVSFPTDNQSFSKADQQITIKGVTDVDSSVTVNGFVAIVDSNGNFTYDLKLNNGENKISVISAGKSGQTTTKELTVSYSE